MKKLILMSLFLVLLVPKIMHAEIIDGPANINVAIIDGPANIRETPQGEIIISLNDGVQVDISYTTNSGWHRIQFPVAINKEALIPGEYIKKGVTLRGISGEVIGVVKETVGKGNIRHILEEESRYIVYISAYTYMNNIKQEIGFNESNAPYVPTVISGEGGLIIEEYKITWDIGLEKHECFDLNYCVPNEIMRKREKWKTTEFVASPLILAGKRATLWGIKIDKKQMTLKKNDKDMLRRDIAVYPFLNTIQSQYQYGENHILEYIAARIVNNEIKGFGGVVLVNGEDLHEKYGYEEIFNYVHIDKKPFYFFNDGSGYINISYDGNILPTKYVSVRHYLCCSHSAFNPRWNTYTIRFFARKLDGEYYVEAGVYKGLRH
jgi:hypothetical protein